MSAELIERLVTANRILANEDIIRGFGHVSVRVPDEDAMYISRALSPAQVTRDDIIKMSFDGEILDRPDVRPYKETVIHRAVYRNRDGVDAVVHHHADPVVPFTISDVEIEPAFHNGALFHQGVPTFDKFDDKFGRLVVSEEEGERMAANLGDCRAQLIAGHGANVVDRSLKDAVISTVFFVKNAEYQYRALQLDDEPNYYTGPDVSIESMINDIVQNDIGIDRKWNYLVSQLPDDTPTA
ncbi:class II aldolase/adducin family protein [Natrinema soli]|uniref:Class II aldolase/adducin family protein n=1 Tax=Natrinema soli TaxID=1930624 RepID=A0ABD5SM69_9EURY|nr:class II aldolase/adducin family protein [Natrinema soli]